MESRGGLYSYTLFFGLKYYLSKLNGKVVTLDRINEAEHFIERHMPKGTFNREGWEYILKVHNGHLPLKIKALKEGLEYPTGIPLFTVENTDPNCYWLTNFVESLLLQVWYPTTVATQSRHVRKIILNFLEKTGDPNLIDFKLHDFGFRGASSSETAAIGGAAHLLSFKGTDTLPALSFINQYYPTLFMPGFSIPAAEHSTITSWGKSNELEAYKNMLNQYPEGIVAVVSDSYNIYEACEKLWGEELKESILNRNGTLVIRPDSGDPITVLKKVFKILGEKFGYTINEKTYKVLPPQIRVIQGDGVNPMSIIEILTSLEKEGWSADNISFGMGGALLQKVDRDTQKFAFKCSCAVIDGKEIDVFKDPVTDSGKKSKTGFFSVINNQVLRRRQHEKVAGDSLETVFLNGKINNQLYQSHGAIFK